MAAIGRGAPKLAPARSCRARNTVMPDRPFPFEPRGPKLRGMRAVPRPRRWNAPAVLVLLCIVSTIALTALFVVAPGLTADIESNSLFRLAA